MTEPTKELNVPDVTAPGLSGPDVTALITLFSSMLGAMEGRLISKMEESARGASERWAKHDHDAERTLAGWTERFVKLEKALDDHLVVANLHFAKEHDEEVITAARVVPVKTVIGYVASHWRTILLVIVSVMAVLGFSGETIQKLLGS